MGARGAAALLVLGLGAGGAAGSIPAALLLGRAGGRPPVAACLVFATWTALLFPVALWLARLLGAGSKAALFAGLSILVWGVVSGIGVVGGEDAEDYGRAVVASCLGLAGALALLWGALMLVQAHLLLGVPAPVDVDGFRPGDLLLVRRDPAPGAGELVLLRDAASREAVLARANADGGFEPVRVDPDTWAMGDWLPVGRVFYGFGPTKWGGRSVGAADDNQKSE